MQESPIICCILRLLFRQAIDRYGRYRIQRFSATPMSNHNLTQTVAFLWTVSDLLSGDFRQFLYERIILPFTLLRRPGRVPEESKNAVLAHAKKLDKINGLPGYLRMSCLIC